MDEEKLLKKLCRGNQQAIESVIQIYSAYVITVIHRRSMGVLSLEDEEEIASDVFFSLWQNARSVHAGHLKAWLGKVAGNKTVDRLRRNKQTIPLEEHTIVIDDPQWEALGRSEQAREVHDALQKLGATDREIFHRYYTLDQNTNEIAAALRMRPATVRTRLRRGRELLRKELGGFVYESET